MICSIEGCARVVATGSICRRHHELARTNRVGVGAGTVVVNGYRRMVAPFGHPLANAYGHVLEHRMVLFDKLGPGSHPCHWCHRLVSWITSDNAPNGADRLVVDHINEDRLDNRPENLVAACRGCNSHRNGRLRDALGRFA